MPGVEELVAEHSEEIAAQDDGIGDDNSAADETLDDASSVDEADSAEDDGEDAGEDAPEEEGEQEPVAADGRKMPDGIKKVIALAKGVNPEAAKIIKSNYFENQEVRAAWGSVAEAVAAKTMFDQIGGKEGVEQIESERQEWQEIDSAFAEGKPEFVQGLAQQNPEAFQKIAPHVVNEWAKNAPEQFGYFANSVSYNTMMQQPGVEAALPILVDLHNQLTEAPWAQKALGDIVRGVAGLKEKASQFEQKRVDPERSKLEQDRQSFEEQKRASFETGIADKADAYLADKMPTAIATVVNGRKVDPEAMRGYEKMVKAEVMSKMGEIPSFAAKLEAYYRSGDAKASIDFIQSKYNALLPEAAKVIAPFLRNIPGGPVVVKPRPGAKVSGERPVSQGEITLKEMPSWDELDPAWRQQPNSTAELMQGRAVLRNGKKATGWA